MREPHLPTPTLEARRRGGPVRQLITAPELKVGARSPSADTHFRTTARAPASRTIPAMAITPFEEALLRRAPAGAFLDALVLAAVPAPGLVTAEIGPETIRALLGLPGLAGKKIAAANTRDRAHIRSVLSGPHPSVVRALCFNPTLSGADVSALVTRAVKRKDGALAVALIKARPDLALVVPRLGPLFGLLSTREGHPGGEALAGAIAKMTPDQFAAYATTQESSVQHFVSSALSRTLKAVSGRRSNADPAIVAEILNIQGRYNSSSFTPSRGLLASRGRTGSTMREHADKHRKHRYSRQPPKESHSCTAASVAALGAAVPPGKGVSAEWESWSGPFVVFAGIPVQKQIDTVVAHPLSCVEALFHFPSLRSAAMQRARELPVEVLTNIVTYSDGLQMFVDRVEAGDLGRRTDLGELSKTVLSATSGDLTVRHLELQVQDPDTRAEVLQHLDYLETSVIKDLQSAARSKELRDALENAILDDAVRDPYAWLEVRAKALEIPLARVPLSSWCTVALDFAADRFVERNPDINDLRALVSLMADWEGTFGELITVAGKA